MSATPDLEDRLRAALSARADLVQPEDLRHDAPVVPLRRSRTPLILLASAACVLLVLALALRLSGTTPKAEPAPRPDQPDLVVPPDVGRDWKADDLSTPARLDLDGDGTRETVDFLAEPDPDFAGRTRLQTTLSSTGEEAYGMAQLATTIGTTALEPIDADEDGDQELVLYREDLDGGPGVPRVPLVFDLRDGLLVQALPVDPDEFLAGEVPVPGESTEYYDMVHTFDYWIEEVSLYTTRSRAAFASGNMTLLRPETYLVDTFRWRLQDDGLLHPEDAGCREQVPEGSSVCGPDAADDLPYVDSEATDTFGPGERADLDTAGFGFGARLDDTAGSRLVVELPDGSEAGVGLDVPDPLVNTTQTNLTAYDAASLVVTSASDPSVLRVLVQSSDEPDRLVEVDPVGETALGDGTTQDGRDYRSWLTANGALVTVVEEDGGSWQAWQWQLVGPDRIAALPWGSLCFDDVEDPTTARRC